MSGVTGPETEPSLLLVTVPVSTSNFTVVVVTLLPSLSTVSFVANLTFVFLPSAKRSSSLGFTFSSSFLKSASNNVSVCLPTTKPDF